VKFFIFDVQNSFGIHNFCSTFKGSGGVQRRRQSHHCTSPRAYLSPATVLTTD